MLKQLSHRLLVVLVGLGLVAACEPTNQGYVPAQPINYSHAVHAGAMQIPCQYCHYGAERGRYAGIPSASICMNCHTQVIKDNPEILKVKEALASGKPIEWVRVHFFPDHAYFNHSVHVNAKVACQSCHGAVESMGRVVQEAPLTMGWCLKCHRQSTETQLAGLTVGGPSQSGPLTDCAVCHH